MSSHTNKRNTLIRTRSGSKYVVPPNEVNVRRKEIDYIDAFGITTLVGYEAESNHGIGLCTATYSDYHYHLALARIYSYIYRTRSKHRLIHACIKGNAKWFNLLWKAGNINDMINLLKDDENLVYHLLHNAQVDRQRPRQGTLNRIAILRVLLASPIDMMEVCKNDSDSDDSEEEDHVKYNGSLNLAIARKNSPLANELLKYPKRIDPNKPHEYPPIVAALRNDFWEIGAGLAAIPSVNLDARGHSFRTPLQRTVIMNNQIFIYCVFLLNQDRIDVNYMHENEEIGTALHIAISYGHNDLIPSLLSFRSIDVNVMHPVNSSPLHYSVDQSNLTAVELLLQDTDRINVNLTNNRGRTALALACRMRSLEMVQSLLSIPNIAINTKDIHNQYTPLHEAVIKNADTIVKALVRDPSKCDVNVQDKDGRTPLHLAVRENPTTVEAIQRQLAIIQTLLSIPNIAINTKDMHNQYTPLHEAVIKNADTIVKALVRDPSKCDVNVQDKDGRTPLHLAVRENPTTVETIQRRYEIVRTLAAVPTMNFNRKDYYDSTALRAAKYHLAFRGTNTDRQIVEQLLKYGRKCYLPNCSHHNETITTGSDPIPNTLRLMLHQVGHHRRVHGSPWDDTLCYACGYDCTSIKLRELHEAEHHDLMEWYPCPHCKVSFRTTKDFYFHFLGGCHQLQKRIMSVLKDRSIGSNVNFEL